MAPILGELLLEPPRRFAEASCNLLKREIVRRCRRRHSLTCLPAGPTHQAAHKGSKLTRRRGACASARKSHRILWIPTRQWVRLREPEVASAQTKVVRTENLSADPLGRM